MKKTLQVALLLAGLGLAYLMGTAGRTLPAAAAPSSSEQYLAAFHACAQEYPDATLAETQACAKGRTGR